MSAPARAHDTAAPLSRPRTSRDVGTPADVTRCDLSTYLERARLRLGVQVKEIAYWWQCDHAYVSRVLANKDPLPDYRLADLPDPLRVATLEEWAAAEGVLTGRRAAVAKSLEALAVLAEDPLNVPLRMAKAALPDGEPR